MAPRLLLYVISPVRGPARSAECATRSLTFSYPSLTVNLPLIPITLVLSRTPLIDSLLPFLPLTLVLSTSPSSATSALSSLSLSYPPSPALTLCLLPWARVVYLRLRKAAFDAALGRRRRFAGGLAGLLEEMQQDHGAPHEVGRDRIEVVAEIEVEMDDPAQREDNALAGDNRLRVGIPRFTSLVMGALLFPAMTSAAGVRLKLFCLTPVYWC